MATGKRSIETGVGPLILPLTNVNGSVGTTPLKILSGLVPSSASPPLGNVRICKLTSVTSGVDMAFHYAVAGGASPAFVLSTSGASNGGCLVMGGGGVNERFGLHDSLDLYVVGSTTTCVFQLSYVSQ